MNVKVIAKIAAYIIGFIGVVYMIYDLKTSGLSGSTQEALGVKEPVAMDADAEAEAQARAEEEAKFAEAFMEKHSLSEEDFAALPAHTQSMVKRGKCEKFPQHGACQVN